MWLRVGLSLLGEKQSPFCKGSVGEERVLALVVRLVGVWLLSNRGLRYMWLCGNRQPHSNVKDPRYRMLNRTRARWVAWRVVRTIN